MTLTPGSKLGPYQIQSPLGAGGMGEVYRALDTRLERTVAIKVLPATFANDAARLQRFEQEARTTSALNYPNIVTIYDVGQTGATFYIAMEYVEGRSLRQMLDAGSLPLKKTLAIAAQVADGLAKAHSAGIVHRDLKPENVMVTSDGHVKVLDFGLAKLVRSEQEPDDATVVVPASSPGAMLGTAAYMSPEQARGQKVDYRSDQFSLGTVLYEMLTGKHPFQRQSSAQTLVAIIEEEPSAVTEANRKTPVPLAWIVERCLAKDPDDRYQATRDLARDLARVRDHLSQAGTSSSDLLPSPPAPVARRKLRQWILAAAALLAGVALGALLFRTAPAQPPSLRVLTFSGADADPCVSPDGRVVAFQSWRDGTPKIWMKQIGGGGEAPLTTGTDSGPRFSPDGAAVLFTRRETGRTWLYRTAVFGGQARRLAEGTDGEWSPDGKHIVFLRAQQQQGKVETTLWMAAPDGTDLHPVRTMSGIFQTPRFSPDGRWIAATSVVQGITAQSSNIALLKPDGSELRVVRPVRGGSISGVLWTGNNEFVYARTQSVTTVGGVVPSSTTRLIRQKITGGEPEILLWYPGVITRLDAIAPGQLIFDANSSRENLREQPLPAGHTEQARWLTRGTSIDRQPMYSPDGQWAVFSSNRAGNLDIWAVSTRDGSVRRLTDDPAEDWDPGFTDKGKLIWSSDRSGHFEIWTAEVDGSGARQLSQDGVDAENPTTTPDGWIVYNSGNPERRGLWKMREDGSEAKLLRAVQANWPEVSPDGKYVVATVTSPGEATIQVAQVDDGAVIFQTEVRNGTGRARFLPDGKRIAFTGENEGGRTGIFVQDFVPHQNTVASRRELVGFAHEGQVESFGFSRDGRRVIYAVSEQSSLLVVAEGLAGINKKK